MSFAQDVKTEIVQKKLHKHCCTIAACYGIACFGRYFDERGVVFNTEQLIVAQYAKRCFAQCDICGDISEKQRPSGSIYEFKVDEPNQVSKMLQLFRCDTQQIALRIDPDLLACPSCVNAFIAAAFLCCGTMTDPKKEYNLEFLCSRYHLAKDLEAVLGEHEFGPHRTVRKGLNVVYVKSSGKLEDLLAFMGAGNSAMRIMDNKLLKEIRNNANRLTNCETANMDKIVTANVQAIKAINFLKEENAYDALTEQLKEAAQLRLEWPELSLAQLAEKSAAPISKSGLSHRLKKIERIAESMQQRRSNDRQG